MVAYGRQRIPGKIDPAAISANLLAEMLADSPLVVWRGFDDGGTDLSGNSRTGTVGGSITTGTPIGATSTASYTFPGTASAAGSITMADASWQSPHAGGSGLMTWEALIVPTDLSAMRTLWYKGVYLAWEFILALDTNGSVLMTIWQSSGTNCAAATSAAGVVSTNTPAHIVATWSRAAPLLAVYVNGVSVASSSSASGTSSDGGGGLVFGYRGDNSTAPFLGNASHLALYDSALSADRVLQHAIVAGLA